MLRLNIEQPPFDVIDNLKEYLARRFVDVDNSLSTAHEIDKYTSLPEKPVDGKLYYFPNEIDPDILIPGLYFYQNGVYTLLSNSEWVRDQTVQAAYGGILSFNGQSFPDIDSNWQHVNTFDTVSVPNPKGIVQDISNDGLILPFKAVYRINVNLTIEHNEVNSGRVLFARINNPTNGDPSNGFVVGTGRNVGVTNVVISAIVQIDNNDLNNVYRVEVSSPDSYTNVTIRSCIFDANSVSEILFL